MEHEQKLVVALLAAVLTAVPAGADVRTWDGGGADSKWATVGNWTPDGYRDRDNLIVLSGAPTSPDVVTANSGGTITLDGSAVVASFSSNLYIGDYSGPCRLDVLNGADVTDTDGCLGRGSNASGTAIINGPGSRWTNVSQLYVGREGTGTLSITDGGVVTNTDGFAGWASDSSGEVTVIGAGSTWTNSLQLFLGQSGTGTLSISGGGAVSNTDGYLGWGSDASGEVTVSGLGSTWTNSGNLFLSYSGTGEMSITDGGAVSNTNGSIGFASDASATATVSGAGSTWTNSGSLIVSNAGTGALHITDGGTVSNTSGEVGCLGGSEGTATVSGAGSTWTNSDDFYVGHAGTGEMSITNGAAVSSARGFLGDDEDSSGVAIVSGAGSTWTNTGVLYYGHEGVLHVGREGTGAMSITNGGAVSNTCGYVAEESSASGEVTVSGAGSTWTNSDSLAVGYLGTGTLSITDGGVVTAAGTLTLGCDSSGDGTVNLEGGSLTAEAMVAGDGAATFNWTGGTLGITGSGGLRMDSTGLLGAIVNIDAGKGLNVAAKTDVRAGVTLAVTGGTLSTGLLDVSGTAQLRSGTITIGDTFSVKDGGELEIAGQDLVLATAPKLQSGCELIFDDTTITTPSLLLPSGASIDLDSGKISVAGGFGNEGVVRMGNTGPAVIRAIILANQGVLMGKGTIQAEVDNRANMVFSGDVFFTEDVKNNEAFALIAVSGGAGATFYEDVINYGEIRVGAGCTATFYGDLTGNGTTGTGTVYLDGDMRPGASPGEMSFDGDVVLGMVASLEAQLAGTAPGTGYDVLDVAADLSLAGTLNVVLIDGFDPALGDTFDLLDWGALDGTFNTVNLPNLDPGLAWNTSELYSDGVIAVVPEPATLILLAVGGLALIRRKQE